MVFKVKLFGWAMIMIFLGVCAVLYALYILIFYYSIEIYARIFITIYGGPFLLVAIIFIWLTILKELDDINVSDEIIEFRNIISGRKKVIQKIDIIGYRVSFFRGYSTFELINTKNKTAKKIHSLYYSNTEEIIKQLRISCLE